MRVGEEGLEAWTGWHEKDRRESAVAAIGAIEKNLDAVYCRDYEFRIPVYQRPYAWEREQVGELLDDLMAAMDRNDDEPYFLGSIVLIKREDDPSSQVVDGQQRLTTLAMLLCVLRELTEGDWPDGLDERIRQRADVVAERNEVVRLQLRDLDQGFFHTYVQTRGGMARLLTETIKTHTDSQERIVENVRYLHGQIEELGIEQRSELAQFVINRCYLVVVTTSSQSSAYRIFSVMNDRGLDLSPTDILKAEITGAISEGESRANYAEKWEAIEEGLGREPFAELFSHIRMVFAKDKLRRNLQDEFRDQVLSRFNSERFIDEVLVLYAEAYGKTIGLDDDVPADVKRYLKHLSRLDNVDWIPPVMELFKDPRSDPARLNEYVAGLERLAYGLFILRSNVNQRIARFAAVTGAIQANDHDEVRGALDLDDEEKSHIVRTLNGPVYGMTRVRKPLLLRLDGLLAGAEAEYDHPTVTIEHVLPQRPEADSTWLEWFPDDEERVGWTHRLANLVLLSSRKNTRASNYEFERKKAEYFQRGGFPPFPLTMPVLTETEWTPTVLQRRQEMLLEQLRTEWHL